MKALKQTIEKIRFEDKKKIFKKYITEYRIKNEKINTLKELDFELINKAKVEKNNFLEALIEFNNPSSTLEKVENFRKFLNENIESFEDNIIIFSDLEFLDDFFNKIDSRIYLYVEIVEKLSSILFIYLSYFLDSEFLELYLKNIINFTKKLMNFKSFKITKNNFLIFIVFWDKSAIQFTTLFFKNFDPKSFKSIFENSYRSNYNDIEIILDFFCIVLISLTDHQKKEINTSTLKDEKKLEKSDHMVFDIEENKKVEKEFKFMRLSILFDIFLFFLNLDIDDNNRNRIVEFLIQIIKSNQNFLHSFINNRAVFNFLLNIAKFNKTKTLVENIFCIISNCLAILKKDIDKNYLDEISQSIIEICVLRIQENPGLNKSRIWLSLANLFGHSKITISKKNAYILINLISEQIKLKNENETLTNLLFTYNNFMSKIKLDLQFQVISLYIDVLRDLTKIIFYNQDVLILLYALKILNCYLEIDLILHNKTSKYFVRDFLEDNGLHFCLEEAQKHPNKSVYALSDILIDKYFDDDSEKSNS